MEDSLEQAFAQADEQLNNTAEEAEETEEVSTAEETESQEENTAEATEESAEVNTKETSDDSEEAFTSVNPEELPEELKGVYKSLQADYTRKTQELADQRKQTKSEIAKMQEQLNELQQQRQEQEQPQKPKSLQEQIRETVKSENESERVSQYRDQAIADYENADPRLKLDSETYDEATDLYVGQKMDKRLSDHLESGEPEYTFNHQEALESVLSEWDEYVQSKQQAFFKKQSEAAKKKAKEVNKQNPKGKTKVSRPKKPSLEEAIRLAEQSA